MPSLLIPLILTTMDSQCEHSVQFTMTNKIHPVKMSNNYNRSVLENPLNRVMTPNKAKTALHITRIHPFQMRLIIIRTRGLILTPADNLSLVAVTYVILYCTLLEVFKKLIWVLLVIVNYTVAVRKSKSMALHNVQNI